MRSEPADDGRIAPVGALPVVEAAPVRVANYRAGARFGPRRLPDFELLWMLDGSTVRHLAGGPAVELRPGTLSLGRPGTTETYHWDPGTQSSHAYVHFRVTDPADLPHPDQWPDTREMTRTPLLAGLCQYLLDLGTEPGPDAVPRTQQCLALLLDIFLRGPWGDHGTADAAWLEPMVRAIGLQWAESGVRALPVAELAESMAMSRGHLSHLLAQHHGCGPARLVELVRLARGAVLLQSGDTVGQVATAVGYANPYHFSRRFRQAYGVPPSRFRQRAADPYGPLRRHELLPVTRRLLQAMNPQ